MKYFLKSPRHMYVLETDIISLGKLKHRDLVPPPRYRIAESHIPLTKGNVDPYHAVIERHHVQNYFVLTDLNTSYGTYVNNYKIQNRSVRLVPGDVIRFGSGGNEFEFGVASDLELGLHGGARGKGGPFVETGRVEDLHRRQRSKKRDNSASSNSSTKSIPRPEEIAGAKYHVIDNKAPLINLLPKRRPKSVPIRLQSPKQKTFEKPARRHAELKHPRPNPCGSDFDCASDCTERRKFSGRILSGKRQTSHGEPWYFPLLRDKDRELLHMGDQISRLLPAEEENKRKDELIDQLTGKLAEMEDHIEELKTKGEMELLKQKVIEMTEEIRNLEEYEDESHRKDQAVAELRDEISRLDAEKQVLLHDVRILTQQNRIDNITLTVNKDFQNSEQTGRHYSPERQPISYSLSDISDVDDNVSLPQRNEEIKTPQEIIIRLAHELKGKKEVLYNVKMQGAINIVKAIAAKHSKDINRSNLIVKINTLEELEQNKKDCIITKSFVESLQTKANRGHKRIHELNTAIEESKKESREANEKSKTFSTRFLHLKEGIKHWRLMETISNELQKEQNSLRVLQAKVSEERELLGKQSREFEDVLKLERKQSRTERSSSSKMETLQEEIKQLRSSDLRVRVQSRQDHSRLERFRAKIIQALFSSSANCRPDFVIDDELLVKLLQKAVADRKSFLQLIRDTLAVNPSLTAGLGHYFDDETLSTDTSSTVSVSERRAGKSKRGRKQHH